MALIPNVPFTSGAVFSPEAANAIANPVFDGEVQYLGHLAKVTDTDLDDDPTSIKARVANNELNLRVSAGSGLNALYTGGKAIYGQNIINIGSGSVSLAASSSNFVYVDVDGLVKTTTNQPPIVRALLAIVTTNTTGVLNVFDEREGYKVEVVKPYAISVRNFGGRGDSGGFLAAGGEYLADGEYYFTDFSIPLGRTVTVDRLARIFCSGNVNIAGSLIVTQAAPGASSQNVIGVRFFPGSTGTGFGAGTAEDPGATYSYILSPVGSGGGGGTVATNPANSTNLYATSSGGAGGGGILFEVAGSINITGSISANGSAGANGSLSNLGASAADTAAVGAGGGGSGGLIQLKALNSIVVSGNLAARGGAGGNGVTGNVDRSAEPGGGGGGGRIVIFAPSVNTTNSTLDVSPGANGINPLTANAVVSANGGAGGSYGGSGGDQLTNGGISTPGSGAVTIRTFVPVG